MMSTFSVKVFCTCLPLATKEFCPQRTVDQPCHLAICHCRNTRSLLPLVPTDGHEWALMTLRYETVSPRIHFTSEDMPTLSQWELKGKDGKEDEKVILSQRPYSGQCLQAGCEGLRHSFSWAAHLLVWGILFSFWGTLMDTAVMWHLSYPHRSS